MLKRKHIKRPVIRPEKIIAQESYKTEFIRMLDKEGTPYLLLEVNRYNPLTLAYYFARSNKYFLDRFYWCNIQQ